MIKFHHNVIIKVSNIFKIPINLPKFVQSIDSSTEPILICT